MKYYIVAFSDPILANLQTAVQNYIDTTLKGGAVIISDQIIFDGANYVTTLVYKQ